MELWLLAISCSNHKKQLLRYILVVLVWCIYYIHSSSSNVVPYTTGTCTDVQLYRLAKRYAASAGQCAAEIVAGHVWKLQVLGTIHVGSYFERKS